MTAIPRRTIHALGLSPIGVLVWFYLYVIRQRLSLGYWPRPSQPDPKDAGLVLHHLSLVLGMTVVPGVTLMTLGFILRRRSVDPGFRWVPALLLALGSFGMYLSVVRMDPGHYVDWFWD